MRASDQVDRPRDRRPGRTGTRMSYPTKKAGPERDRTCRGGRRSSVRPVLTGRVAWERAEYASRGPEVSTPRWSRWIGSGSGRRGVSGSTPCRSTESRSFETSRTIAEIGPIGPPATGPVHVDMHPARPELARQLLDSANAQPVGRDRPSGARVVALNRLRSRPGPRPDPPQLRSVRLSMVVRLGSYHRGSRRAR